MADKPDKNEFAGMLTALQQINDNQKTQADTREAQLENIRVAISSQEPSAEDKAEGDRATKTGGDTMDGSSKDAKGGFLGGLFKKIGSVLKGVFMKWILIIGVLFAAALAFVPIKKVKEMFAGFKKAFMSFMKVLSPIVNAIWDWSKNTLFPGLIDFALKSFNNISDLFGNIVERFKDWNSMSLSESISAILGVFKDIGVFIWEQVKIILTSIEKLFGGDGTFVKSLTDPIEGFVNGVVTFFTDTFKFDNYKEIMESMISALFLPWELLKTFLINPLVTWLGEKFEFDPSSFTEFSLGQLIFTKMEEAIGWFNKIFDIDIGAIFKSVFGKAGELGQKLWGFIKGDESIKEKPDKPSVKPDRPSGKMKKGKWLQQESKKWAEETGRNVSEFGQAHGGAKGVKKLREKYLVGGETTPTRPTTPTTPTRPTTQKDLKQLKLDEGFRSDVYDDTEGIKTIGYGFNLERAGAQESLDAAGIDKTVAELKQGNSNLSEEEADRLMRGDYPHFADSAKRFVGKDVWSKLSADRQKILTNMAYNMGESGLNKFKKLKAALKVGDYKEAANQMADSTWSKQVKGRADRLQARMMGGGNESNTGTKLNEIQVPSQKGTGPITIVNSSPTTSSSSSTTLVHQEIRSKQIETVGA